LKRISSQDQLTCFNIRRMYYLKLSGFIPENKQMEFEQTYRFVITQIPLLCNGYRISKDVLHEGIYNFTSYWSSLSSVKNFAKSPAFLMMLGAFNTLGKLYENVTGEMIMSGV